MQEIPVVVWNLWINTTEIKLFGQFAFKIAQDVNTFPNHFWRYLVGHRCGGCSVAATEREHMHFHKASFAAGFECLFELGIGLTRKSDDDIRAEGWIVAQHIANLIESF